jgi:hypothetical protein
MKLVCACDRQRERGEREKERKSGQRHKNKENIEINEIKLGKYSQ